MLSALLAARLAAAEIDVTAEDRHASERFARLVPETAPRYTDPGALAALARARPYDRVRVLGPATGPASSALPELVAVAPHVEVEPVSDSGYVELRRYVVEQSRSVAEHRHGNVSLVQALERRKAERTPP